MLPEQLSGHLDKIITYSLFQPVFKELKETDFDAGANIENSLRQLLNPIHEEIQQNRSNSDRLNFFLYRESVELKAHASAYLRYSEMIANYEAKLLKFSIVALEKFFDRVIDGLSDYLMSKREIIFQEIDEGFKWYTGLKDTSKKGFGSLANIGVKGLRKGLKGAFKMTGGKVAEENADDKKIVDDSTLVEELFRKHLGAEILQKDITTIVEKSAQILEESWKKEIKDLTLDMGDLRAFSQQQTLKMEYQFAFELGYMEQAFTIGMGSAAAATLGFAAGWHTITYALVEIFPWAAAFAIIATLATAILTKQRSIDKRKSQVREAIENIHRLFSSTIDMEPLPELGNKTLRQSLNEKHMKLIGDLLQQWNNAIAGKLTVDHYRKYNAAITRHLLLIQDCLEALKAKQ